MSDLESVYGPRPRCSRCRQLQYLSAGDGMGQNRVWYCDCSVDGEPFTESKPRHTRLLIHESIKSHDAAITELEQKRADIERKLLDLKLKKEALCREFEMG